MTLVFYFLVCVVFHLPRFECECECVLRVRFACVRDMRNSNACVICVILPVCVCAHVRAYLPLPCHAYFLLLLRCMRWTTVALGTWYVFVCACV